MVDCPKIHLLPNLTKYEFQLYKQVELDEKIKFHTSRAFAGGRKASNPRRETPGASINRFSLMKAPLKISRPHIQRGWRDEATSTIHARRRGRDRKPNRLLSSFSLSPKLPIENEDHLEDGDNETDLWTPALRREATGRRTE